MTDKNKETINEALERWSTHLAEETAWIDEDEINLIECLREGPEEDLLEIEELDPAPAKIDDFKAEVQDPLIEVNLGTAEEHRPVYISGLMEPSLKAEI